MEAMELSALTRGINQEGQLRYWAEVAKSLATNLKMSLTIIRDIELPRKTKAQSKILILLQFLE